MKYYGILLILIFAAACNDLRNVQEAFKKATPYEKYVKNLEKSDLHRTPMIQEWIAAGNNVFQDSLYIDLPYSESGSFQKAQPIAHGYRFDVSEGQVLTVNGEIQSENNGKIFIDLFIYDNGEWKNVAYADTANSIQHEFNSSKKCLLRLQPELMIDAFYIINLSLTPTLANPVSGASNKSIGSIYGDIRDGGNRSHEGVDIFAPRGTPVIAPTDGYVSRVGTNKLGGKVIWMRDRQRNHSYYFAHLDSQIVRAGISVKKFDTLGTVGNTGNARTTPPHLHFGIYQHGSKDPIHFIRTIPGATAENFIDSAMVDKVYSVQSQKANLRTGPGTEYEVIKALEKHTYLQISGKSNDWLRVTLPDKSQGYLSSTLITPVSTIDVIEVKENTVLLSAAAPLAIPKEIVSETRLQVKAIYNDYLWVENVSGNDGWLLSE